MNSSLGTLPRWNLNDLYVAPDAKELHDDIARLRLDAEEFRAAYAGKLATLAADTLANAIARYEAIQDVMGRIGSYAQLLYATDMTSPAIAKFYQDSSETVNEIATVILFFTLELNRLTEEQVARLFSQSKTLAHYAPWLRDIRAYAPYQLSDELEQVLHEKTLTGSQAWNRLFDETLAGLKFPYEGQELSCAEILNHLSSADGAIRKKAAKSLGETLGKNAHTFSFITNTLAKDKEIEDRLRKFPKPISSRNVSNFIEDEVVQALISSVKRNYPALSHRYYALKAKWLGKQQLDYWDRNAPLPSEDKRIIPWEEAQTLVLTAYGNFSCEMAEIGKQFFDKRWIDAPVVTGKDSGAFSHPTVPSAHPYILMNYQGKTRDVMTLAHELGHGVHQVLSARQGALMADTPLTLAETASVFGEQLTFRALLEQEKDPAKRRIMIAGKVEDMLNTVVRQVAFCEFERHVHDERRKGEIPLARLCEIWMQVQKECLGDAIRFEDEYKYYWSYIPHFIHSPFYVYSYAFGDCLVNALYAAYQEKPEGFEQKYLTMLKSGGTLHHKELLAPFGLDATDPNFWQKGLDIIAGFIDELE